MPVIKIPKKRIDAPMTIIEDEKSLYSHLSKDLASSIHGHRKTYQEDINLMNHLYSQKIDGFITLLARFYAKTQDNQGNEVTIDFMSPVSVAYTTQNQHTTIDLLSTPEKDYIIAQCPEWNRTGSVAINTETELIERIVEQFFIEGFTDSSHRIKR